MKLHSVEIENQRLKIQIEPNARRFITLDIKRDRLILFVPDTYDIKATQHGNQVIAVEVKDDS